jgi:hypothetical protein
LLLIQNKFDKKACDWLTHLYNEQSHNANGFHPNETVKKTCKQVFVRFLESKNWVNNFRLLGMGWTFFLACFTNDPPIWASQQVRSSKIQSCVHDEASADIILEDKNLES